MKYLLRTLALPLLALAASPALAHNPMCECEELARGQVKCTGGFYVLSDAGPGHGGEVDYADIAPP